MSSGAFANFLIVFILTPVLTRIFSEEQFGVYYQYFSLATIISTIILGTYPVALVIPKLEREFLKLLKLVIALSIIGTLTLQIVILIAGDKFMAATNTENIGELIHLLPFSMFLICISQICNYSNIREALFKKNSSSMVVWSGSEKGSALLLSQILTPSAIGLVLANVVGNIARIFTLLSFSLVKKMRNVFSISNFEVFQKAREFIKYPTRVLPSTLISTFTSDLPLYLLVGKFGIAAVGFFGMARNLLNISYNLIGQALAPVYFKEAASLYVNDKARLKELTKSIFFKLLVISCLGFGLIFGFGDIIFKIFLGDEWLTAGKVAAIISVFYVFKIISSPFSNLFNVAHKEDQLLILQIVIAICRILGIYIGISTSHLLLAIAIYSFSSVIGYAFFLNSTFALLDINAIPLFIKSILIMAFIFGCFYLLRLLISNWFSYFQYDLLTI